MKHNFDMLFFNRNEPYLDYFSHFFNRFILWLSPQKELNWYLIRAVLNKKPSKNITKDPKIDKPKELFIEKAELPTNLKSCLLHALSISKFHF